MRRLDLAPLGNRVLCSRLARRELPEFLLGRHQLTLRDLQQLLGLDGQTLLERQLRLELVATEPEGSARLGRDLGFEVLRVRADRGHGFGRRVGKVAQQRQFVHGRERAWQVALDEALHAAQRLERGLHEDAGGLLDVLLRLLQQARRLPQLRQHAPRTLLRGA